MLNDTLAKITWVQGISSKIGHGHTVPSLGSSVLFILWSLKLTDYSFCHLSKVVPIVSIGMNKRSFAANSRRVAIIQSIPPWNVDVYC